MKRQQWNVLNILFLLLAMIAFVAFDYQGRITENPKMRYIALYIAFAGIFIGIVFRYGAKYFSREDEDKD